MSFIKQAGWVVVNGAGHVIGTPKTEKAAKRRVAQLCMSDPGCWYTDTWYSDEDDYFKEQQDGREHRAGDGSDDGAGERDSSPATDGSH